MNDSIAGDVRFAIRGLIARPGFSAVVILTLALGIGANAAIFSAVHGLLLRPAPFLEPDRLVRITTVRGDEDGGAVAVPEFDDLRALPIIEDAALYTDQGMYNASGFGTPEELPATITTHNLFRVLGVSPLVGSTFPATFDRTRNFGLVISHALWVRKFGRDPHVVGRTMTLDGAPGYTIHGVMPAEFNFPSHSDLFRSNGISADPKSYTRRDLRDRMVVARLRRGVTLEQARAVIDGLGRRLEREFPQSNAGVRFSVTPIREMYTATIRPYVLLVSGAVVVVLLVACSNVANLLLSRSIARNREMAIKTALGAGRWRVIRHTLTESVVLAGAGGIVGAVLAICGVRLLIAMVPVQLPSWMRIQVDGPVGMFLGIVAISSGLAAGLVPAFRSGATELSSTLKEGARGTSDGLRHGHMRSALIVIEVALALVLLVGASLLLQSLWRLHQVDLGFRTSNALTFRVELGWAAYGTLEKTTTFHRRVLHELRRLPGVQAVTFDNNLPLSGKPRDPVAIRVAGQSRDDEARNPYVNGHLIGPDYFAVMDIGIRRGRTFDERDRPDSMPAVIVSERLAARLWPGRDPIGQRLQPQNTIQPDVWHTVVGIAEPVLHHELDGDPGFAMYRPYTQASTAGPHYVIRTAGDPMSIARTATSIIGMIDPNQSFLDVHSYEQRVANRVWQRRVAGTLFGAFAALAVLLAAIGLYGVLSYAITHQTREIGIRLTLGATSGEINRLVLRRGLMLTAVGVALGLAIAAALSRAVSGVLYDVSPLDPFTFLAVPPLLFAIAALACYLPARRASRVDPMVALRAQ